MGTDTAAVDDVRLSADEADIVALELVALLPALSGPKHARYAALYEAVSGEGIVTVPAELLDVLESVLEVALRTGRARALYRAEGERLLTAVLRRTPRGRRLSADLDEVNHALKVLAGHPLDGITVRMRTLGHYTLTLQTPTATLTLALRPDTVQLESLIPGQMQGPA
jgi:hypothetical protein